MHKKYFLLVFRLFIFLCRVYVFTFFALKMMLQTSKREMSVLVLVNCEKFYFPWNVKQMVPLPLSS